MLNKPIITRQGVINPNNHTILAIETATEACSIALLTKNGLYSCYHHEARAHTRLVLPMINALLEEAGESLMGIDALAFGVGPGSFTGVRIAYSIIQGLSVGLNKPIIGVSSLRILAQGIFRKYQKTHVVARIDARMNEIYWAVYQNDANNIMQLQGQEALSTSDKIEYPHVIHAQMNEPIQESETNSHSAERSSSSFFYICPLGQDLPEAQDLAVIALHEYELGHTQDAMSLQPKYLR